MNCNCGSSRTYQECCGVYHHHPHLVPTAEALMRSRYCAYTLHLVDYIYTTTLATERIGLSKADILKWAMSNKWMGLEIVATTENVVEFKAHYLDEDLTPSVHHEKSTFKRVDGKWYFVRGVYPK